MSILERHPLQENHKDVLAAEADPRLCSIWLQSLEPCSGSHVFLMNDLTMDDCTLPLLNSEDVDEMTCSQESNAGTRECEMAVLEDDWVRVCARPTHNVFLSHSGAQKDFVEQLCEDLERAGHSPFFDKRTKSLPKGEEFAGRIFIAAEQCDLAIVVVSEEYFTRTKWPMQELVALERAPGCKILPLFFGISCKEFNNPERRHHWYQVWDEWAKSDTRISVPTWKNAVRELDRRNGMEYVKALGEVQFRKEVVSIVNTLISSQDKVIQVDSADSLPSSTWQNSSERRAFHMREWTDWALLVLPRSMVEQTPQGALQAKGVWGNLLYMVLRTALQIAFVSVMMYLFYLFAFHVFFPVMISSFAKLNPDFEPVHSTSFPFKSTSFP